jgi:hypothetical protein
MIKPLRKLAAAVTNAFDSSIHGNRNSGCAGGAPNQWTAKIDA